MAEWNIARTRPIRKTYGRAIPVFIHNLQFHLTTVDVYSDGAVDCWGFVDLPLFEGKIKKGWVVTRAPVGAALGVHGLGGAAVAEASWERSPEDVLRRAREIVRELTPEGRGLLDMQG